MPTKQHDKQQADEKQPHQQLKALIGKHVLHTLGQPGDLRLVQVRQLWEGRYRVNVLVGADAASARVAHSYFLVTDGDGNVVESTPALKKHY